MKRRRRKKLGSIEVAALAVRAALRSKEATQFLADLQSHARVVAGASDPTAWHVSVYSRNAYTPIYHIRKQDPDRGGMSMFLASITGHPRLAGLVAMLLNAYESATNDDLLTWMEK